MIFVGELKLLLHVVDNDFQVKLNHLDDLQTVFFNNFKTNTVIRTRYEKQTSSKIYHLFRNRKERKKKYLLLVIVQKKAHVNAFM